MRTIKRLSGSITTLVLAAGTNAYAEEPALTDPPDEVVRCEGDVPSDKCPAPAPEPQPPPPPAPVMTNTNYDTDVYTYKPSWYERIGIGLSVGGGVDDFVGDSMRDATNVGGGWNVRATLGTRSVFGLEGSYIGSAQQIHAVGIDDDNDATLVGNGLQAAARLNVMPSYSVQPFIYGGMAWRHYDLSQTSFNTSVVDDSDDVFEIPVGIGVAGYVAGLMADVRAEYRGAWGDDLIPALDGFDDSSTIIGEMDRWGVTGSLGAEF